MKYIIWACYENNEQFYFETPNRNSFKALYKYLRRNSKYGMVRIKSLHGYLDFSYPLYKQV